MKFWQGIVMLACAVSLSAKDVTVIEMNDFRRQDMDQEAFRLKRKIELKINARGMSDRWDDMMTATCWILDSETRKVVWEMTVDNSEPERRRYFRETQTAIELPEGDYELYYGASSGRFLGRNYKDFGDFLEDLFSGFSDDHQRRDARRWGVEVSVAESDEKSFEIIPLDRDIHAAVRIAPMGDDEFIKEGFSLKRKTDIRILAIGEGDDGELFDYGWITDAVSGERVWEMRYRHTDWAGGAEKNRMVDEVITLDKGDYIVHYVTDGSHSFDEWNLMAPYDPRSWGITLWTVNQKNASLVKPYEPDDDSRLFVDLTRVSNDRFEEQAFTISKPMKVRVVCLGEYSSGYFSDYGWIVNAKTRETVWEMTRRNTRHAGGARKNRMFDGIITLQPGSYRVYYITDGSHAYRRFNSGPPFDPEAWGIALYGMEESFSKKDIKPFRMEDDPNLLVQLIRVGDYERLRERFTLDKKSRVRVYAIGEGDDDEMYDYGWIENENGRRVWRMDYWDTRHAGGGEKNRMINEVITLDPGEYTVYYRSDGSHSFEEWNTDRPRDFIHWGITVTLEK